MRGVLLALATYAYVCTASVTIIGDPFIHQAVVELRYDRGLLYWDRVGSCLMAVKDKLGEGFAATGHPSMVQADLTNAVEQMRVSFGSATFTAAAAWPETLARLVQVSRDAWQVVGGRLEIESQVTRLGVRVWSCLPLTSPGVEKILHPEIIEETSAWRQLFGTAKVRSQVTLIPHRTYTMRVEVGGGFVQAAPHGATEIQPEGEVIMLDLDFVQEKEQRELPVSHARVADFVRLAAQESKKFREALKKRLVADEGQ